MPAVMNPANVARELNSLTKPRDQDNHNQETDYDTAQDQKLPPPARIADIPERDTAPDFRENQNHRQRQDNSNHSEEYGAKNVLRFAGDRIAPLVKIRLAVIEHDDFLAEREKRAGELFEALGEFLEVLPFRLKLLRIGGGRLIGQFLTLLDGCPQRVSERRAQLVRHLARIVGFFDDSIDLVHGAHVVIQRHRLADQPAGVGKRRFGRRGRLDVLLRVCARTENLRDRSGQLIDTAFESTGDLAVGFHERRHFLNGIEESLL